MRTRVGEIEGAAQHRRRRAVAIGIRGGDMEVVSGEEEVPECGSRRDIAIDPREYAGAVQ